ncbi:peptidase M23 [Nitritalea halalkaliphila LW7]|uniref:Peptidase M23 n=1 Tax=Nitritalea halalkaliphila LW7 TaxID=1189621 RepID=I5BZQ1_9BACT|nr:hypothetical protein [Nitritalea halalkaliphila]EIM75053.1 peptidase M23 [Nitritalea halalkaliphila LW7]
MSLKQKAQEWVNKKFIIVIRREIDFSVIRSFSVSKASGLVLFLVAFVMFFILGLIGANTFLKRWADPRFLETENA